MLVNEYGRIRFFRNALGKAHVIGMRVCQNHRFNILDAAPNGPKALREHLKMARKSRIHQRQSSSFFEDVPIKRVGREVMNSLCQFHDCNTPFLAVR